MVLSVSLADLINGLVDMGDLHVAGIASCKLPYFITTSRRMGDSRLPGKNLFNYILVCLTLRFFRFAENRLQRLQNSFPFVPEMKDT